MNAKEKYNLIFIEPSGKGRGSITINSSTLESHRLISIQEIHISECEYLIEEIDKALQGELHDNSPSFDWADLDIQLVFPSVILYDVVIPMVDFKMLLREWIDFNRKFNKDIL